MGPNVFTLIPNYIFMLEHEMEVEGGMHWLGDLHRVTGEANHETGAESVWIGTLSIEATPDDWKKISHLRLDQIEPCITLNVIHTIGDRREAAMFHAAASNTSFGSARHVFRS